MCMFDCPSNLVSPVTWVFQSPAARQNLRPAFKTYILYSPSLFLQCDWHKSVFIFSETFSVDIFMPKSSRINGVKKKTLCTLHNNELDTNMLGSNFISPHLQTVARYKLIMIHDFQKQILVHEMVLYE